MKHNWEWVFLVIVDHCNSSQSPSWIPAHIYLPYRRAVNTALMRSFLDWHKLNFRIGFVLVETAAEHYKDRNTEYRKGTQAQAFVWSSTSADGWGDYLDGWITLPFCLCRFPQSRCEIWWRITLSRNAEFWFGRWIMHAKVAALVFYLR